MKFMRNGRAALTGRSGSAANISRGNRRRKEREELFHGFLYKLRIFDSAHKILKARMSDSIGN